MRKTILLSLVALVSLCASAQLVNQNTSAYYIERAGKNLLISTGLGIGGAGLALGAAYVDFEEDQQVIMFASAGICSIVSIILFVDAGISLNKAGKLLKEEQRRQEVVRIEPSREGVGVRFTF